MKKYAVPLILTGIIVVLVGVLVGVLFFLKNQPPQARTFQPVTTVKALEPDSSLWGLNYPNEYNSLLLTAGNNTATKYGGSAQKSYLTEDPRLVILFAGYSFGKDYNQPRGHQNTLIDVRGTKRLDPKTTHATCYSCKSSDNPGLWDQMGMEAYDAKLFTEMTSQINNPIGCANCHEAGTMRLAITNPAVEKALQDQDIDWHTYTRQQMRSLVCANCHVTYFFQGADKVLTVPWANGMSVEGIIKYEDDAKFADWKYPGTDTPIMKSRHPDYELYAAGSTHFIAGVACADCHMPYLRDGAMKYSSHDIKSPLLEADIACGQCHTDVDTVLARVNTIQDTVYNARVVTEDALIDAITALKAAAANPKADAALLDQARTLHRHAQFMWDFISSANSMGFHNPDEALRILQESADLARQCQMISAQAAGDLSLLQTGIYEAMEVKPTPAP
jgi:nitrite reductase (cytochrome c-552)